MVKTMFFYKTSVVYHFVNFVKIKTYIVMSKNKK